MASAGQELNNPIAGQRLIFRRTAADTDGELLEVESVWSPGSDEPVAHYHPRQEEHFEVRAGTLTANVNGEQHELHPGDELRVPPGARHSMWNGGPNEARAVWQTRPALETEAMFEAFFGLAQDGKVTKAGLPDPLQSAVLLREFKDEFRLAKPPGIVQAIAFPLVALAGRALGRPRRYAPASTSS